MDQVTHKTDARNRILLGIQAVLSALMVLNPFIGSCMACTSTDGIAVLPVAGLLFYGGLAITVCKTRRQWGICLASGVHLVLLLVMLETGPLCPICLIMCGIALFLLFRIIHQEARNLLRFSLGMIPLGIGVAGVGFLGAWNSMEPPASAYEQKANDVFQMIVYERPDCPWCQKLRDEYLVKLKADLPDLHPSFRDAVGAAFIQKTPTIFVGTSAKGFARLEGLPETYIVFRRILFQLKSRFQKGGRIQ